jgi:hypothetical protein
MKKLKYTFSTLSVSVAIFFLLFFFQSFQATAQPPNQQTSPGLHFEDNKVYLGIWINNIYSYDYLAGSYTVDMYLYFFWVDPNITTIDWYLMNGYPVNPVTTVLISSNLTGDVKDEIYRVTAACSTTPDASDFPFDSIKISVAVELLTHGNNIEIVWLDNESGVDRGFVNAGWKTTNLELTTSEHVYPLDAVLPRAELVITQQRQREFTSVQYLIPLAFFAIVSAFSFLFSLRDAAAVGLRLGLNTSMLVTTLLFNFTVSAAIPPSSSISLYALFSLSILIFIILNLIVTITGFVQWFYYKNEIQTKDTNRWGFIISLFVPVILFILIYFLRG